MCAAGADLGPHTLNPDAHESLAGRSAAPLCAAKSHPTNPTTRAPLLEPSATAAAAVAAAADAAADATAAAAAAAAAASRPRGGEARGCLHRGTAV